VNKFGGFSPKAKIFITSSLFTITSSLNKGQRPLFYKHRIPKAEEPIFFLHSDTVSLHNTVTVIKGRNQHQESAFGQVEIGDEGIHCLEFVAGIDKDSRFAAHGMDDSVFICHAFNGTAGGGSHADETASCGAAGVDDVGAFLGYRKIFGVHDVIVDAVHLDGAEGTESNVKHDGNNGNTLIADARHQILGEMQARRGCRRRSVFTGIDGLITIIVLKPLGNIGRQRHEADDVQQLVDIGIFVVIVLKADQAVSFLHNVGDLTQKETVTKDQSATDTRTLAGFYQRLPHIKRMRAQQKQLDPCLFASLHMAVKSCGNHAGVVDDECIAGLQVVNDIVKMLMENRSRCAIKVHQARMVTGLQGRLRNALLGQVVVKIRRAKIGLGLFVYNSHINSFSISFYPSYTDKGELFRIHYNTSSRIFQQFFVFYFQMKGFSLMNQHRSPIFRGAATALITPFRDGGIDFPALERMIEFQIAGGIDAIVIAGTTGEASTLSDNEHHALLTYAAEVTGGRVPLIAGTGSNDTAHAVDMSKFACACGYDALLLVTPYYNRATETGLIKSYISIAENVDRPIILYHVPSRTGVKLTLPVYRALAEHPNIVAVKEASGDMGATAQLIAELGDKLDIYSGNDDITIPIMSLGGLGVISVVSNLLPRETSAMCHSYLAGDTKNAAAEQLRLLPLINALFAEINPIPVKCAAAIMGLCREEYRLPLCAPAESTRGRLLVAMRNAGLVNF